MTETPRFGQDLATRLWELAPAPDPAALEETLLVTAGTRQRRAWVFRWWPADPTRPASMAPSLLVVLTLLALALVVGFLAAGARRPAPGPQLFAPFGPAGNGLVVYSSEGDLYTVDPLTDERRLLVGHAESDGSADFSPDGSRLFFVREIDGEPWLMVSAADGTAIRPVMDRPALGVLSGAWGPDSQSIAMVSELNGRPRISIHPVSGTTVTTLDLGLDATWPVFRPPDGRQLAFRGAKDGFVDLYLVEADGGGLTPLGLTSSALVEADSRLLAPAWSPDGRFLAYHTVDMRDDGTRQTTVHLFDTETGQDRVLGPQPPGLHQGWALWSPDGTRIAVQRWEDAGTGRFAILDVADDTRSVEVDLGTPTERGPWIGTWSPDGSTLLEFLDSDMGVLSVDPVSGQYSELAWPADEPVAWQRVAP